MHKMNGSHEKRNMETKKKRRRSLLELYAALMNILIYMPNTLHEKIDLFRVQNIVILALS